MLLSDYFKKGAVFPPKDEQIRIENEKTFRRLFENDYVSLFKKDVLNRLRLDGYRYVNYDSGAFKYLKYDKDNKTKKLVDSNITIDRLIVGMPLASTSTKIFEKLTVGRFPDIKIPNATEEEKLWLEDFQEKQINKYIKLWSNERDYRGNAVIKQRATENGIVNTTCNASNWFVVLNEFDEQEIIAHVIWRKKKVKDDDLDYNQILLAEIHTKGQVEYVAFSYNENGIQEQLDISEVIQLDESKELKKTGLSYTYKTWKPNGFIVFQIRNSMDIETPYGKSDYEAVFPELRQLVVSITSMANIFDKTADPPLQVPEEMFEEVPIDDEYGDTYTDGTARVEMRFRGRGSAVPMRPESKDLKYAEFKGNLVENMSYIDKDLLTGIFIGLSINRSVLGIIESSKVNASGEAYKKQMQTTLDTARSKVQYTEPVIKELIKSAYLAQFKKELKEVDVIFKEGISLTDSEKITNAMLANGNKPVMTLEESIEYIGKSEEEAKIIAKAIRKEDVNEVVVKEETEKETKETTEQTKEDTENINNKVKENINK